MATQMTFGEALAYFKGLMDAKIEAGDEPSYKAFDFSDNELKLYRTEDKSDTPDTISFPEERFLDQAKTVFVEDFAWSDTAYPGSYEPAPSLDGKPVMVLAVKGDTDVTYSFVSLEKLMPGTVKISAEEGNVIESKADGLYVGDVSGAKITTKEAIDALFAD